VRRSAQKSQSATKLNDHIRELAMRLFVSAATLVIVGIIVYFFYEPILTLLRSPLGAPLYYSNPAGSFAFVMKICFMGALTITIPVIIYNLIMFIQPAFEKSIPRKHIYLTTILSSILAIAGAVFAFTCILPGTLEFFAGFQTDDVSALISADSYLTFVTNIIITFVIIFQLPLLITFIDSVKPLKPKRLFKMEKWVVLGSLIIALLAPFTYDLVTSILIAVPIIVLYNLSIVIVLIKTHARANRKARSVARKAFVNSAATTDFMPELMPSFNELVAEMAEVKSVEKTPASVIATPKRTFMDIAPSKSAPKKIMPAKWVYIKPKQITLSNRVRLISDIRPQSNRVLA
jgi:sec-independent protein translocase protein TatC